MGLSTVSPAFPPRLSFWLKIARAIQILVICLTIGLFIISIPINYEQRLVLCTEEPCPQDGLTLRSVRALNQAGLSLETFVGATLGVDILIAAVYTASAVVIFIRKPNDLQTIFVTMMLVTFGAATFSSNIAILGAALPSLRWLTESIDLLGSCAIIAFLLTFPTGRFTPRWSLLILAGWVLFQLPLYYFPNSVLNLSISNPLLYNLLFPLGILSAALTQVYRYRKISGPAARQQTKWVVFGLTVGLGGFIAVQLSTLGLSDPGGSDLLVWFVLHILATLFMLLPPLSITIAVLRYRLWDINPIINRTLVYGALSAATMALYILAVGLVSSIFQSTRLNYLVAFLATGLIAVLFEPLRKRLQRVVNHMMYGERDDPATILSRLSERIDAALAPDAVLSLIVDTVAQALHLPYAAITLSSKKTDTRLIYSYGEAPAELHHFPLVYQSERVGEMLLAPRAKGEAFSPADLRLLNIIFQQAGVAAHTLMLTAELQQLNEDLQQSRERLVMAQEEERRRLRRDLHDGIGPTLASLSMRLEAAADLVVKDPQAGAALLQELKGQVRGTVAEIRRLVYALRPPVLDEFGLVSAIREHTAAYSRPGGLRVSFDVQEPLPALPAAVEVAAYRIALEAFTNTINHAGARNCFIRIWLQDGDLQLEISDDGAGLSDGVHPGVGLSSMRERAAELGGESVVESLPAGGTRVHARLPIIKG